MKAGNSGCIFLRRPGVCSRLLPLQILAGFCAGIVFMLLLFRADFSAIRSIATVPCQEPSSGIQDDSGAPKKLAGSTDELLRVNQVGGHGKAYFPPATQWTTLDNRTDHLSTSNTWLPNSLSEEDPEKFPKFAHSFPRVFCWVLTQPKTKTRAMAAKATWLRKCDGSVFISSVDEPELPAINAGVGENRSVLWGKTKFAFRYAYEKFLAEYDWFLKADDDTYVVVENLKHLLSNYSRMEPLVFGSHFQRYIKQGYMSGGAGYVLSRESVRRFIEKGLDAGVCRNDSAGNEDTEMGRCLEKAGVKPGDSRDELGRGRFFPLDPSFHLKADHMNKTFWYGKILKYPENDLLQCCSNSAISFHYITKPENMYTLEYLIYHLKPQQEPISSKIARTMEK